MLLIGLTYTYNPRIALEGCISDIVAVKAALQRHQLADATATEYRVLRDDSSADTASAATWPSRRRVLESLRWLVTGLARGDAAYIHFSGHGNLCRDVSGDEELGYDSFIYLTSHGDATGKGRGRLERITDDEMRAHLVDAVPAGCTVTAVFDCCNSGSCLDLRYRVAARPAGISVKEDARHKKTNGQVILLSACMDTQKADEATGDSGMPCGALTKALLDTIEQDNRSMQLGRMLTTVRAKIVGMGFDQVPQLSCGRAPLADTTLL